MRIACVYATVPGVGGLGVQVDNVLASLALVPDVDLHACGPPPHETARCASLSIRWSRPPEPWFMAARAVPVLRARSGALTFRRARHVGQWAASRLHALRPALCYAFTQVALEPFEWCRHNGVPTVLESPNGHIRNFRRVYLEEHAAWCSGRYLGHPTEAMVSRVEREYALADRIRVSSSWSRESLAAGGVPRDKLSIVDQPVDLARHRPPEPTRPTAGPLRVCFVGSLDLRKGFVYLLEAFRGLDPGVFALEIVGATGDRCCRRLVSERLPPQAAVAAGDPRAAYGRADVFVLPTLEDGSPFAVAEAMASGLPVIVTSACGAAEWVGPETGWVVPPRDPAAIRRALEDAAARRPQLEAMGQRARADTERRAGDRCDGALAGWVTSQLATGR